MNQQRMNKAAVDLPYRPCVGIMVINMAGKVWVGRRIPKWPGDASAHVWQMPQGGIDKGEAPEQAALRELHEETGIRNAHVVGEHPDWLHYDLPKHLVGVALKGKYRGQRQKWFALRFAGSDSEIDISARDGHKAEFDDWRWAQPHELGGLIVPFKKPIYEAVVREFAPLTRSGSSPEA